MTAVFGHGCGFVGEFGAEFGLGGLLVGDRKSVGQHGDVVYSEGDQVDAEHNLPEGMAPIENKYAECDGEEDADGIFGDDKLVPEKHDVDGGEFSEIAHAAEILDVRACLQISK